MKGITIATFISKDEIENDRIYDLVTFLKKTINIDMIIFSEKKIKNTKARIFITPQMTKYRRIKIF